MAQSGRRPSLLFNWRRRMLEGGLQAVQADGDVVGTSRVRELERRVRELERLLGRETMEVEILKEALDVARVKKPSFAATIMERSQGGFAMKAVADTLVVARSNLIERVSRRAKSRRPYRNAGDDELLALIHRLVDERPTYGYRRIRRLKADGKPQSMASVQVNKLTLERHTGRRPGRRMTTSLLHCARTSAGAPITSSSPVVMARSCVCRLLSMPVIARSWPGWPLQPASPARWCAT